MRWLQNVTTSCLRYHFAILEVLISHFATSKPEDISLFARQCQRGWKTYVLNSLNIYPAFFVRCWIFIIFVLDYVNKT